MLSRLVIPAFRYGYPQGDVKVYIGLRRFQTQESRIGADFCLKRLSTHFRLSNPAEEYRAITRERNYKNTYAILMDPIVATAGTDVKGEQDGTGKYFLDIPRDLVKLGKIRSDVVLSHTRIINQYDGTRVFKPRTVREVDYFAGVIHFDPEELSPIDGMPTKDNQKENFRLFVAEGVRPVRLNSNPHDAGNGFRYDLDTGFGFFDEPSMYDNSQCARAVIDGCDSPEEALAYMASEGILTIGFALTPDLDPERRFGMNELLRELTTQGAATILPSPDNGYVALPSKDAREFFHEAVKRGSLETVYLVQ